ncbi:MAG: signal peptide peptidase SppA [Haliscomenobacter sp.]|uniref:signal peptide peptidase SppA n=1 Tax=Haliscomenobacter sp. TaxID=2717303 RepID=UPI0029B8AC62|nr:signal peptide peptidase SppA [Haliscomenobacter sp.]MDX2072397.1 signal peptide peptidase SppA [Haliscomenobacter sp.]
MGQFFKMFFASCLGVLVALGVLFFVGIGIIGAIASSAEKTEPVGPNSVLRLTFDQLMPELTNNVESASFSDLKKTKVLSTHDVADAIRRAGDDDNIKGILLEPEMAMFNGFASARTVRQAIEDFKKKGKFVVAHGKFFTRGSYYVASVADEAYINPSGYVEINGFAVQQMFYKRMLDNLGIKMQIYYAGKFKGATEPYRLEKFSPENKLQYKEFLADFYDIFLNDVAKTRKKSSAELRNVINQGLADSPEKAVQYGLFDKVMYRQELIEQIKKKLGLDEDEDVKFVNISQYDQARPGKSDYKANSKIAVLYAEGDVIDGRGNNGSIGDKRYVKAIEKMLDDEKIKAIVLRVNSGGGSALASENIWYALTQAKEAGKPLVVSMGDVAASGGYYIACMADTIYAEPNTITGSIGVFRMIPSIEKMMANKLGITMDSVKTGPFALGLNLMQDMSPEEARRAQVSTEEMYALFLKRVADGRKMSTEAVNEIAQGRVWSGVDARRIGLVDKLGGLDQAIKSAAKLAKVKDYRTVSYPSIKDPIQQLVEEFVGETGDDEAKMGRMVKKEFPELAPMFEFYSQVKKSHGFQSRLQIVVPF